MKFFTPELLERYRSHDEKIADSAADEWEAQTGAYGSRIDSIRSQLPSDLGHLMQSYSFHDAQVIKYGQLTKSVWPKSFALFLSPLGTGDDFLFLLYRLKNAPVIKPYAASSAAAGSPVLWLYDEVDLVETGVLFNLIQPTTFRHSILLSNHVELQLDFTDFRYTSGLQMGKRANDISRPQGVPAK